MEFPLNENVKVLEWIIGKWVSFETKGQFPTISDFTYCETLNFESVGQPSLNYIGSTKNCETGAPMFLERGFLKIKPGTNEIALIIAQNIGVSAVEEGTVEDQTISLETTYIGRISFSKQPSVCKYQRKYWLEGDTLNYTLFMETENTPLAKHVTAKYRKVKEE